MLTEHDLKELINFRPRHPVLSVYLDLDPSAGSADAYKLRLRQMLKDLEGSSAEDNQAAERYIEH
jgi:hypothetical protein